MIDSKIIKDLGTVLTVPIYGEKPADASGDYVVVSFLKRGLDHGLGTMSVICDSYSTTLYKAAELNREVEEALNGLIAKDYIRDISRNSSSATNRPDTLQYRYKCNFDCYYYEEK